MVARGPAGAASSRSCRLRAKTRIASASARSRSASISSSSRCSDSFDQPRPARGLQQPGIGRAAVVAQPEMRRDHGLAWRGRRRILKFGGGLDGQAQHLFIAPAQQRQRAVRWHGAQRLAKIEPVAVLRGLRLLALDDPGHQHCLVRQRRAQPRQQVGILARSAPSGSGARRRARPSRPARGVRADRRRGAHSAWPRSRARGSDRRTAHRPAAPGRRRAPSAPSCGAWA